jgi:hypothetical protein
VSSPQWTVVDMSLSSSTTTTTEWDSTDSLKGLYTCLSCQIGFHSADLQRQHHRTDWYSPTRSIINGFRHRYNLKRKVAELPPVTAEVFAQKVLGMTQFYSRNSLMHDM